MALFLSEIWFEEVQKLNQAAGDLHLSPNLSELIVNIKIINEDQSENVLHLKDGKIHPQAHASATSNISIDRDALTNIINEQDPNLAIEAFMIGKIRIDGDMNTLFSLQSTKATPEQKQLYKSILTMTQF